MKTNNEKWQGNSKGNSNSGAGRDGRPFEKRDVKSILKGSRGAAKSGSDRPARDDNRTSGTSDYKKRDDNRPAYGDKKTYGSGDSKPAYGDRKPFGSSDSRPAYGEKKSFHSSSDRPAYGDRKPYENREGGRPSFGEKRSFESRGDKPAYGDRKPYENREGGRPSFGGPKKPWENRDSKPAGDRKPWESRGDKPAYGDRKPYENREGGRPSFGGPKKPWENRDSKPKPWEDRVDSNGEKAYGRSYNTASDDEPREGKLSFRKPAEGQKSEFVETRYDNKKDGVTFRKPAARRADDNYDPNSKYSNKKQLEFKKTIVDPTKPIRLNKFLANAGICSRREADEYIQAGVISVNGEIVTEMGVKVLLTDKVMFHEQTVRSERKVYLLLNKPKDCVTTSEDTHDRLTVLDLVKNACSERIYPVGRLDRNTTGVLLLTNDGDLASKLTHPKYDKKKIYHATLDKPLEKADFETILAGVPLDDLTIAADALEFVKEGDLKQVGIEIHSGQNRVVRRIFEKLGYKIIRLDRVFFAGLTKKQLPRGKYRFLSEREVAMLKMGAHE